MKKIFDSFAQKTAEVVGSSQAFIIAAIITSIWLVVGPLLHFSDTWQLIISTISSAVTFLMVFIIQYAQNKDTKALHLKLDELLRANKEARNKFVDIEEKPEEVLTKEEEAFEKLTKENE